MATIATLSNDNINRKKENKITINKLLISTDAPMYEYYVVLDFEATCCDKNTIPKGSVEIIEFPSVCIDARDRLNPKVVSEIQLYVKPVLYPKLTKFCTELTGINQETVDHADNFPVVYKKYIDWLQNDCKFDIYSKTPNFSFVTCGDWDLKTALPQELSYPHHQHLTSIHCFRQFVNIKKIFTKFYQRKARGMAHMLNLLDMELIGKHHSGIDDCRNTANILIKMLKEGSMVETTFNQNSTGGKNAV